MGPFPVAPIVVPALARVQGSEPIGSVTTIDGAASAVRADGAVVALAPGAPVFAGDTLATEAGAALAVTFVDGTVFALGPDARMVVDDLVYDPSGGSAAFDLLTGTFAFVTGSIADQGAMAVTTPVATIGIRGTSVAARLGGLVPLSVTLLPDPDGHLGTAVVANGAGVVTLDQAAETTRVLGEADAPEPPAILDPAGLAATYGGTLGFAGLSLAGLDATGPEDGAPDTSGSADISFAQPVSALLGVDDPAETADAAAPVDVAFAPAPEIVSFNLFGIDLQFLGIVTVGTERFATVRLENGELIFVPIGDENFVFGGGGVDSLAGGAGIDIVFGFEGDDVLFGADGEDELFGGAGNDRLLGGADGDILLGGDGDDTLDGGAGFDLLLGGPGDDVYFVDGNLDLAVEEAGEGTDVIVTGESVIVLGNIEFVFLQGIGDAVVAAGNSTTPLVVFGNDGSNAINGGQTVDTLFGAGGSDFLGGDQGDDLLVGGQDADLLAGGAGRDQLFGGAGADAFAFAAPEDVAFVAVNGPAPLGLLDIDTVFDFQTGFDQIVFSALVVPGAPAGSPVPGFDFSVIAGPFNGTNAGANAAHAAGAPAFVFSNADDALYFDANGDAAGYTVIALFDEGRPAAADIVVGAA